ncbi:MAG: ribosomal protein S18-alanine N-acetyltransferase [Motiliproteus sp.]
MRAASLQDLDAISALEQRLFSYPQSLSQLEKMMSGGALGLVILVDGIVSGYAFCSHGGGDADLLVIAVDNNRQKQGFGQRLLIHLVKALQQKGVGFLFLEVRSSNLSAIGFYRAQGFEEIGVRRHYYPAAFGKREDAVLFKLCLTDLALEQFQSI